MENDWQNVALHGARSITRMCADFELQTPARLPGVVVRIHVWQAGGSFTAHANLHPVDETGFPSGTSGFGATETAALVDYLHYLDGDLARLPVWEPGWAAHRK